MTCQIEQYTYASGIFHMSIAHRHDFLGPSVPYSPISALAVEPVGSSMMLPIGSFLYQSHPNTLHTVSLLPPSDLKSQQFSCFVRLSGRCLCWKTATCCFCLYDCLSVCLLNKVTKEKNIIASVKFISDEKPRLLLLFFKLFALSSLCPCLNLLLFPVPLFIRLSECESGAQRLSLSSGQSRLLFSPFQLQKRTFGLPQYFSNELDLKGPPLLRVVCSS